jgi:hypothetical protein
MEINPKSITGQVVGADRIAFGLAELARQLGVSTGFLRLEVGRGKLIPTRLGRRMVVTVSEATRYLDSNTSR